jgi:L-fucose isomerase
MIWNTPPARLQYWMDLANVLSVTPWAAKPIFDENVDRPLPLMYLINGGEANTKMLRAKR